MVQCPLCKGTGEIDLGAMALGDQLRFAREKAGLTLREVESRTGLSNPVISQYENGKVKQPSFQAVMKLCEVYGISPNDLNV
jgi:HTH-type transcriptional regulator, competence development regulator